MADPNDTTGSPQAGGAHRKVRLSAVPDSDPRLRISSKGYTRATAGTAAIVEATGRARGMGSFFAWAAVIEGLDNGFYYLIPTDENDPDRLQLRWVDGGHAILFSLRRFLKLKGLKVPKGHSWSIPCAAGTLDGEPALEMKFSEGIIEEQEGKGPAQNSDAAAPKPPPEE